MEKGRRAVGGRSVDGLLIASHQGSAEILRWVEDQQIPMYWWIENSKGWTPTLSAWTTCAWELWVRSI